MTALCGEVCTWYVVRGKDSSVARVESRSEDGMGWAEENEIFLP